MLSAVVVSRGEMITVAVVQAGPARGCGAKVDEEVTGPPDLVPGPVSWEGYRILLSAAVRQLAAEYGTNKAREVLKRASLTEREAAALRLMARGPTNAEIADKLVVGMETVKTHVSAVPAKLGARDRTQAVIAAYESGFVSPG